MNTRIVPVDPGNAPEYIAYADRFCRDHDESFLPGKDFLPDGDHPAWLLVDDADRVIGALGLLLEAPYLAENRGRFTFIHAEDGSPAHYRLLRDTARECARNAGISGGSLYGFIPADLETTAETWKNLGWKEERRAWLLENDNADAPDDTPPDGFSWKTVSADNREGLEQWRNLINRNFADLAGHVELTAGKAAEMASGEFNFNGGLEMLVGPDGPVGTILVEVDEDEPHGSFLGAITLDEGLRGRGLGRLILRRGLALSRRAGLNPTWLSVNAENENAVRLYLSEGFREQKVMVCHTLTVD